MALRPSLRAQGKISFFAFQDIITAVTGIVIIIALILALHINEASPQSPAQETNPITQQSLAQIQTDIKNLEKERASLEKTTQKLPSISSLQETVQSLQRKITSIQGILETKQNELYNFESAQILLKQTSKSQKALIIQQEALAETKEKTDTLQQQHKEEEDILNELKRKKQQAIQAQECLLTFTPDKTHKDKQAILLIMNELDITFTSFEHTKSQNVTSPHLEKILTAYSPEKYFVVIFIRPSCAKDFTSLKEKVKKLGYEVGYEPIAEDSAVKLLAAPKP